MPVGSVLAKNAKTLALGTWQRVKGALPLPHGKVRSLAIRPLDRDRKDDDIHPSIHTFKLVGRALVQVILSHVGYIPSTLAALSGGHGQANISQFSLCESDHLSEADMISKLANSRIVMGERNFGRVSHSYTAS
jgi:hypothetical protein